MGDISGTIGAILGIIVLTSFIKIFVSLNILRFGIGFNGAGFGAVIGAVSLVLASLTSPIGDSLWTFRMPEESVVHEKVLPILEKGSEAAIKNKLNEIVTKNAKPQEGTPKSEFKIITAAYTLSQLKNACMIGLMFLLPFLLVDVLVANVLTLLGIQQLSAAVVSFPLKLALFCMVDGWTLIIDRVMGGG